MANFPTGVGEASRADNHRLNPLSTGTCGCVTAEVDYQVPSAAGAAARVPMGGEREPRLASAVTPPFHRHVPWGCLDRSDSPPRRRLILPERAATVVASHDRRVLVVGAGSDRGVPVVALVAALAHCPAHY